MDVKDEIKEKLNIVDIVSAYVKLKPAGKNYVGLSPFTNEKTPSFYVSPDRNLYYCFSTNQGGDIFSFVQKMEGLDFRGALKVLAEKAGVSLRPQDRKKWEERDVLFAVMEEATKFFEATLQRNAQALEYLKKRGLENKTIQSFRLGFAPLEWRKLKDYLESKGFSEPHIEKAGLIKKTEKGSYDRFRSRIMFPIADTSGRVVAFSGRIFIADVSTATEDQKNAAKYLNSPDTPLFNKSEIFFGLDRAKNIIKKHDFAILVEGQMDLLMLHQIGYTNTVAGSGTALTDKTQTKEGLLSHMGLIQRLTKNLLLAYDSDRAGINAARKAARIALALGMDTKVIAMPSGVDPADYVLSHGKEAWATLVRNAVSVIELLTQRIVLEESDTFKVGRRIREEVLPEITLIPSAVDQDHYLKKVSEITTIPYSALQKDFLATNPVSELDASQDVLAEHKEQYDISPIIIKTFGTIWYLEDIGSTDMSHVLDSFVSRFSGTLYSKWKIKLESRRQELSFETELAVTQEGVPSVEYIQRMVETAASDVLRYVKRIYSDSIERLERLGDKEKLGSVMSTFSHLLQMMESHDILTQELYANKKANNTKEESN